jgi:hypothetical protein
MESILQVWNVIESVFTYFGWGYLYYSAGYFCYDKFNMLNKYMRTSQQSMTVLPC